MATTLLPRTACAYRPQVSAAVDSDPASVSGSASVMYSGCAAAIIGKTDSGVAMVTSPAPARSAALPAMIAAPVFPTDPATINAWPKEPLCDSAARTRGNPANSSGPAHRTFPFPTSSISAGGDPISRTTKRPQQPALGEISWPIFGAVNVTVQCALITG